jgi:hypothetical protein
VGLWIKDEVVKEEDEQDSRARTLRTSGISPDDKILLF